MLDRRLAAKNHYPPIAILDSISRLMPMVCSSPHLEKANSLRRLLEAVGLQRRAKEVPSLSEYLRSLPKHEPQVEARADEVAP